MNYEPSPREEKGDAPFEQYWRFGGCRETAKALLVLFVVSALLGYAAATAYQALTRHAPAPQHRVTRAVQDRKAGNKHPDG